MKFNLPKRTGFTVLFIMMLPLYAMTQGPWLYKLKDKKNPNFHEIQQSFKDYWKGKKPSEIPRGKGYKVFKRWEWFWEPRVGRSGVFPKSSIILEEREKYRASHPVSKRTSNSMASFASTSQTSATEPLRPSVAASWKALGPNTSVGGYGGIGRVNCIAFHPTLVNTFWVGSPAGGIWKTTNGGTSWTYLGNNLPMLGVSAIAVHPTTPDIMYIATGDRDNSDTYSVGILKTTNGGASWSTTRLRFPSEDRVRVKALLIHPTNPRILMAATDAGIYRSTDGGTSTNWRLVKAGNFQEMIFKPGDSTVVYASTIGDAQIFRSVNAGASWSQVTNLTGKYRIALAVTPANPQVVGAVCSNSEDNGFGGYYTSSNSGATFSIKYAATGINLLGWEADGSDAGGQGWYDLCVAISPTNANIIHVGGVNTWKSTNGGSSWALSTMWYDYPGVAAVHADKHAMAYNPLATGTLYQCNDGGVYKTSNGGTSWVDLSSGLQITQFYRLSNSATSSSLIIAGAQDNGTKLTNGSTYKDVVGGDGMEALIDYSDANIMYGSTQLGSLYRSMDGGGYFEQISGALPSGPWITP
jgi:photosystem II stability/assembly factor-like uncharacterized protein